MFNLRYPGQYFDNETGLHYNYFRDYEPGTGRYVESDPIGLEDGTATYSYVGSNPLLWMDSLGLAKGGKKNIGTEGFTTKSDPRDVEEALRDALKKKQPARVKALRGGLLKVIKRGGGMGVIPGFVESLFLELCNTGDAMACTVLCKIGSDFCPAPDMCEI